MTTVLNSPPRQTRKSQRDGENPAHITIQYAPFPPFDQPNLQKKSHKARDLLNATVASFYQRDDEKLSRRQHDARQRFIARFREQQGAYGRTRRNTSPTMPQPIDDMRYLAQQLDDFFFFGQLAAHARLLSAARGRSLRPEGQRGLGAVVGALLHELARTYLSVFACGCARCARDALNTVGAPGDGHGPVFLMLHRLAVGEVRRWDASLRGVLADDCPGAEVSRRARALGAAARERLDPGLRRELNPVRANGFARYRVGLAADGDEVLVRPSFMEDQYRREATLYAKKAWGEHGKRDSSSGKNEKGDEKDDEVDSCDFGDQDSSQSSSGNSSYWAPSVDGFRFSETGSSPEE
ncbi:hypothetical protein GGR52DRAFT_589758 [Hypoxylon sp. FL1284]|nr:hypothetical protein GGR52DRAFT_589758 [Hypoxylon sp. FL1284]